MFAYMQLRDIDVLYYISQQSLVWKQIVITMEEN